MNSYIAIPIPIAILKAIPPMNSYIAGYPSYLKTGNSKSITCFGVSYCGHIMFILIA